MSECPDFPTGTTLRHHADGTHSIVAAAAEPRPVYGARPNYFGVIAPEPSPAVRFDEHEIMVLAGKRLTEYDATAPRGRLAPPVAALSIGGQAPMTYFKATTTTNWYVGGENASAECLNRDICDFEVYLGSLRDITRQAEDHVLQTGHSVQVERAQFRVVNPQS